MEIMKNGEEKNCICMNSQWPKVTTMNCSACMKMVHTKDESFNGLEINGAGCRGYEQLC